MLISRKTEQLLLQTSGPKRPLYPHMDFSHTCNSRSPQCEQPVAHARCRTRTTTKPYLKQRWQNSPRHQFDVPGASSNSRILSITLLWTARPHFGAEDGLFGQDTTFQDLMQVYPQKVSRFILVLDCYNTLHVLLDPQEDTQVTVVRENRMTTQLVYRATRRRVQSTRPDQTSG